jgi:hypothetical protein
MEKNIVIRAIAGAEKTRAWSDAPPNEKSRPGKGGSSVVSVSGSPSSSAVTDTRQQHLEAVTAAIDVIASAESNRVEAYISAGEQLAAARAAGPRGTWGAWLRENFSLSADTAERAIHLWLKRDAVREFSARVRNVSLRMVLDSLAQQKKAQLAPSEPKRKPVTKQELLDKLQSAEDALETKEAARQAERALRQAAEAKLAAITDQPVEPAVEPVTTTSMQTALVDITASPNDERDGNGVLIRELEALYGPLEGSEWWGLADRFRLRGRRKQALYDEIFLKLIQHHNVPVLRWDDEYSRHNDGAVE